MSRFNVSLKSPDYVHKPHLMKRKESRSGPRARELCESRGGRPGLPSLINKPTVSVDVKQLSTNAAAMG